MKAVKAIHAAVDEFWSLMSSCGSRVVRRETDICLWDRDERSTALKMARRSWRRSGSSSSENTHRGGYYKADPRRNDFYQTATSVIVSFYLKKIDPARAIIKFSSPAEIELDLPTTDKKRYKTTIPLYGLIDPENSSFKIMGTKLEMSLVKADGSGWPHLRSDERPTGEIIQVGKGARA